MKKSNQQETAAQPQPGKSYAYQAPQESATDGSVGASRQKLLDAFEVFIDALAARVPSGNGAGTTGTSGTASTGGGTTGNGGTTAGAASAGSTNSTGASAYTGAASGGNGAAANPASGTGSASTGEGGTYRPSTGEMPVATESAGQRTIEESAGMSIYAQREAYRVDRERESARRARTQESTAGAASPVLAAGGVVAGAAGNKHLSDSNRSPVTESREFSPSFGFGGRSAVQTMERMSVPTVRPETVPAPGTVNGRPLDAWWGSFGTAVERAAARANVNHRFIEVIIGTDDRVRVTNNQLYPWRCICSLLITARTGTTYIGTGWLVAPRLVLTAGHCVYMADEEGWPTQIEVIPGRDGGNRPFGSAISRDFRSVTGWTRDNDSNFDYGAILLPADNRYGDQLGWYGYASRTDDHLRSVTLNLSGYPGDGGKPPNQADGTQWFHSRTVKDVMERQITYEIDTYGGQSGAPVWEMASDGSRYGVAIHTWGTSVNNGATRITRDVFDNIVAWAGQAP